MERILEDDVLLLVDVEKKELHDETFKILYYSTYHIMKLSNEYYIVKQLNNQTQLYRQYDLVAANYKTNK